MNPTDPCMLAMTFITYGLLALAIAALWLRGPFSRLPTGTFVWIILFVLSLVCGLAAGFVHPIALLPIAVLAAACYYFSVGPRHELLRTLAGAIILLISVGLLAHLVPGFSNFKVMSNVVFSTGALPYTQYLNFDKALIGLFILACCHPLLTTTGEWTSMLKRTAPAATVVVSIVILLSLMMGYVQFDVKFLSEFYLWAWANLFFTCVAEEALFRGFVQKQLQDGCESSSSGRILGLVVASILFGLAHFAGGWRYIILATVAGLGYGWIYQLTRSIEASILTHSAVNTVHFLFFTYPALNR